MAIWLLMKHLRWRLTSWPYLPRLISVPLVQIPVYYTTNDLPLSQNEPPAVGPKEREPTTESPPIYTPRPEKLIQAPKVQQRRARIIIENIVQAPLKHILKIPQVTSRVKESTIHLAPVGKAVAGERGTAISAPLARAIIPPNTRATVIFHPDSVAIAGPGGRAHAHSDLEIYTYHQ
ncbi:hypothetical protein DMENIID0001_163620 [Sergentomyia squamirostris]